MWEHSLIIYRYCLKDVAVIGAVFGLLFWSVQYCLSFARRTSPQINFNAQKQELALLREVRRNIALDYNQKNCGSLDRFESCKRASSCIFAKNSKLWGSREFDREKSLKDNILAIVPALSKFTSIIEDEGVNLDGFLIELRGSQYSSDLTAFKGAVYETLKIIGDSDPSGLNSMKMKSISSPYWYFSFGTVPIFITTFAPFYGESSSRHMGELSAENNDSCFLLFQPEISFLRHQINRDTPLTHWSNPITTRDKIRVNFRDQNQDYFIPPTIAYPVANHFVQHPENTKTGELVKPLVQFWQ
jgi:FPC/CPF motif-containing protein YcgG